MSGPRRIECRQERKHVRIGDLPALARARLPNVNDSLETFQRLGRKEMLKQSASPIPHPQRSVVERRSRAWVMPVGLFALSPRPDTEADPDRVLKRQVNRKSVVCCRRPCLRRIRRKHAGHHVAKESLRLHRGLVSLCSRLLLQQPVVG